MWSPWICGLGSFAEAFKNHDLRGRSEKKVQEWRDALGALPVLTGFRLADYKRCAGSTGMIEYTAVSQFRSCRKHGLILPSVTWCYKCWSRDEVMLQREVVDEVRRLTPSNDPVDVEQYRVGLEGPS